MRLKSYRLALVVAAAGLAACASNPSGRTADGVAVITPAALEKQSIWPAKPRTILSAYMSSRINQEQLDNTQFLGLSRRLFPAIQREMEAIEISGIKTDPAQTEKTLSKYRNEFSKLPDAVYQIYDVSFGADARPTAWGSIKGSSATYSAQSGGIVFDGTLEMDKAINDFPYPSNFVPAKDFVRVIEVVARRMIVTVPMAEEAYRQKIYQATQAGRHYVPHYDVLVVYKPTGCTLGTDTLSCKSEVTSAQVFEHGRGYSAGSLVRGATVTFN